MLNTISLYDVAVMLGVPRANVHFWVSGGVTLSTHYYVYKPTSKVYYNYAGTMPATPDANWTELPIITPVINTLVSTSTTSALSANQGKTLKDSVDAVYNVPLRSAVKNLAAEAGYTLVTGSFEEGATVTLSSQVVWQKSTGNVYSWYTSATKTVSAGTTPATTGGISSTGWIDRTPETLRADIKTVSRVFDNVAAMVADTTLVVGRLVTTVSYYSGWAATNYGASGGNSYVIVAAATGTADGGSYITLSNGLQAKALFQTGVSVLQFGAKRDGVTDDTVPIQRAINYSRSFVSITAGQISTAGPEVHIPYGVYAITRIVRKSGVSLVGEGSRSTYFVSLAMTSSVPFGAVEIDVGPVVSSHMKGITVCGGSTVNSNTPTNAAQWGLYTHAKWDTTAYGNGAGLWYSNYEDVYIKSFKFGEWSRAGYTNTHSLRPNQFIEYRTCVFLVTTDGIARRFTGQHGQISIVNGDNGGLSGLIAERAIFAGFDPDPSTTADNSSGYGELTTDVSGTGNAVRAPEQVKFSNGTSVQRSKIGCQIQGTKGVSFDAVWFESLGASFTLSTNGGASVSNSRFANAADGTYLGTAGAGYIVAHGTNTSFDFGDSNVIAGTLDNMNLVTADLSLTDRINMKSASKSTKDKTNITTPPTYTLDAAGLLTLKGMTDVWVRAYQSNLAVKVTNIDSYLMPSETLVVRAWSGPITFATGGNILLGGATEVTVNTNAFAMLRRVHGYSSSEWELLSVSKLQASAAPTSGGYYAAGTQLWKLAPAISSSQGWTCTTAGLAGSGAVFTQMPALLAT